MQNHSKTTRRWHPNVTVAAVIEQDNRFLLVRENKPLPVLNQPAGHLENNESLLDAVVREVLEETAYVFEPHYLVGIYRWPNSQQQTYLRFCFAGNVTEKTSQQLDPDILEACWLERNNISQADLRSPLVMQCINDYDAGRHYELSILNDLDAF